MAKEGEMGTTNSGSPEGADAGADVGGNSELRKKDGLSDNSADSEWWEKFRSLLNDQYDWPAPFTFKFIAPKERVDEVRSCLIGVKLTIRASSKGTYHSITAVVEAESAEEVIETYELIGAIEGVVSL